MAGRARIGQFSSPPGPYGGNLPVVRPENNVATPTTAQAIRDAAATNQSTLTSLFDQLKALAQPK